MSRQTLAARLFAPKEAADLLKVHVKTFRRWASESGVRPIIGRANCRRFTLGQILRIGMAKGVPRE